MPKTHDRLQKLKEIETRINKNLFFVCAGVTIVVAALMLFEFFSRGAFPPARMNLFYLLVLIIYSSHKELVRWIGQTKVERQGEYFVYGWIGLTTLLYVINFLSKGYFNYSVSGQPLVTLHEISELTLEVMTIFIFTRVLKFIRIFFTKRQIFKKIQDGE